MEFTQKYTESQQKKLLKSIGIYVDTREHEGKNDHILTYFDKHEIPWIKKKLDAGDYSYFLPANPDLGITENLDFSGEVMIERKANLEEISGNLTATRKKGEKPGQRIRDEFARAPAHKILLIENASYKRLAEGDYNTDFAPKAFAAKLFSMWHEFNIPVIFMPDKNYTGQFIYNYFYYYLRNLMK